MGCGAAHTACKAKTQRPVRNGEGGLKAAWDDFEEDADLDALLGEEPGLNPDMAQMWRDDPELWARLSQGGRETLSQSMYGDARAAAAGHFRAENSRHGWRAAIMEQEGALTWPAKREPMYRPSLGIIAPALASACVFALP